MSPYLDDRSAATEFSLWSWDSPDETMCSGPPSFAVLASQWKKNRQNPYAAVMIDGRYHRFLKKPKPSAFDFVALDEAHCIYLCNEFENDYLVTVQRWETRRFLDIVHTEMLRQFPELRHEQEDDPICRADHISVFSHILYNNCMPYSFQQYGVYDQVRFLDPSYPEVDEVWVLRRQRASQEVKLTVKPEPKLNDHKLELVKKEEMPKVELESLPLYHIDSD
ncbi:hypothetical protein C8J56DRAFT_1049985 [Mycena floridula]|nr:hypothetical protein C8J56DRAFT_1049985 [Mycena floridula]